MNNTYPSQYVVNVSSIQDFMQCRWRWVAKWVLNRVPRNEARPLRFGKLLHNVFEDYHTGKGTMEEVLNLRRAEWLRAANETTSEEDRTVALEALDDLDSFAEPMLLWHDTYPFEIDTLEAEVPFTMPHPMDDSILLRGRPDRVGVMSGLVWHVQNRSLAPAVNFSLYVDLARRNYHEHLYAEYLAKKYPEWGYGGTLFNLFRKLKYRKAPTKAEIKAGLPGTILHSIDEMFWQHPMNIDIKSPLHENVMATIMAYARQMREVEEHFRLFGDWPTPNEKLNGGYYGNRIDEYFRVLVGDTTLEDDILFKEREDTYATEEEVVS